MLEVYIVNLKQSLSASLMQAKYIGDQKSFIVHTMFWQICSK